MKIIKIIFAGKTVVGADEIAAILGLHPWDIHNATLHFGLPIVKTGGVLTAKRRELLRWKKNNAFALRALKRDEFQGARKSAVQEKPCGTRWERRG